MRKKYGIFKKITSMLMAFLMVLSVVFISPKEVDAATPKGYVTLSMEKFTLGLGYIIEPVRVPFYEGDNGADIITRVMDDYGYEYDYRGAINDTSGVVGSTFYLAGVKDEDYRDAEIPQYILDEIKKDDGDLTGREQEGWLGEFDYTYMSGWMYCVNNVFPNYGASSYKPKDGDVIRWQFTVWGYGADISDNSQWGEANYLDYANKDKLTKKVAEVNSATNKNKLLSNSAVKNAYNNAMNILQDMTASQTKVDKAYSELTSAVNEALQEPTPTPTVNKVEGFKVTSATTSKVNLAWNKVDDCNGYKIYRYYSSSDSFKLIKTIDSKNTLTYQNTDRTSATTYRYKIRAYKVVDGKTIYSDYSDEVKATTNPLKPKFASSTATRDSVTLNWNKTSRADGYEVYRYSTSSKKYNLIGEVDKDTTTYTDSGRSSASIYTYKIRAYKLVDGVKHYSNYSDSLKVVTKPLTPVVTLSSTIAGKATVTWSNTSSRNTGYKVYMATSKTGTYSLIKTTTSKSYTKTGLTKGKTYYFKVRAYRTVDGKNIYSDYSSIKSIKVKK